MKRQNQEQKGNVLLIFVCGILATLSGGLLVAFLRMVQTGQVRILETICFIVCVLSLYGVLRFGNLLRFLKK
ncbi:hypothetical protein [Aneurinibacillus aneurinilyticus]|uniref:Uncharacterized protein n=1 Tax=Aneurinibacillus aneurinilyticus ATCC 12856 TaxID=649747 RepID=U1WX24_ANEAE|nr:hypothetical protein [Aneurinibacillus aneurinilyticus]ERI07235.1 hypothetical protein HMPREF0083_04706 [Aneurinibacillus aneurinilyticus ATCC 12856]MED0706832.1 hypothetical protein [Aneurinibacillus aneurinilyticus]MED0709342.1 hypothetical protein [Aneurinibacillus aneurinilyticus]MED0722203.1 hypothetical protein [Aneurinibacillus aneurinilyticus]MED0725907.1 hypothetical protein [Aneurinibacillus aneurinilyticus]